jgi:hypothetical protein
MSVINLCVFWYPFNGFSGLALRFMLKGLCLIAGALLAAFWLIAIRKERIWLSPVIAISFIGFLVCAYLKTAERVGRYSKFYLHKRNYEIRVGEIVHLGQSKATSDACNHSFDYCIDPGPPVRVAYVWGGHLDNWHGVVYDPTGEVLEATKSGIGLSSRNDPSPINVKKLFSSHLISAEHLTGFWYFCDFDEQ